MNGVGMKSIIYFCKSQLTNYILVLLICFVTIGFLAKTASASESFEVPKNLKASDVLPRFILENDLYKIDQQVKNDGLVNTYKVFSKHGDFEVISTVALLKIVGEIEAIDTMKKVEESESFVNSLKESGVNTVEGVKSLFNEPVDSLKGVGKGLTSLFSRAGEAVFKSNPGESEDSRVKQLVGFSESKRKIAHEFHVDVYSTNKVLQDHLNTLAWADYAGGMAISIATLPMGGPVKIVYSSSNAVRILNETIAKSPPSELRKMNREKLAKLNVDVNVSDLFINNSYFSPRQQTYIVGAVEAMSEASNREVALMVALQVKDADTALAITTMTMMYAGYNKHVAKIKQLFPVQGVLGGRDDKGTTVILAPIDYLTWNERLANAFKEMGKVDAKEGSPKKQIWLLGTASDLAQEKFKEKGWLIQTKVGDRIGVNEMTTSK
jgi:hypothetical protein